jgi:ubiquinone/menaquinone biosynthesis C-methylase UbiE
MIEKDVDRAWEYYGSEDPYYGVLTREEFRKGHLTPEARNRFFQSGQQHVDWITSVLRQDFDASFHSANALDFGCGVGRVLIPLAKVCEAVTGVDASAAMIAEARNNCSQCGLQNVSLVAGEEAFSRLKGPFDLIHSFIVFQHIPTRRGESILKELIGMLQEGGFGVLHFTYYTRRPLIRKWLIELSKVFPALYGLRNMIVGRPYREPMMQMNEYNLNHILRMLQEAGCARCRVDFTQHNSENYGVVLFFQKGRPAPAAG